jgi:hypothetical protein
MAMDRRTLVVGSALIAAAAFNPPTTRRIE